MGCGMFDILGHYHEGGEEGELTWWPTLHLETPEGFESWGLVEELKEKYKFWSLLTFLPS